MSTVSLKIAGTAHDGWKSISINRSLETISGAFQLSLTDKWTNSLGVTPARIVPGASCEVQIDGETVITGYIDKTEPSYDGFTHTITVSGRDKAGDLVDCSVITGTGEWKNLKLEAIANIICDPFGIPVATEVDTGEKIPTFNIEQGMTAFEAIQKLCSLRACLAISDGQGGITITRAGSASVSAVLLEGTNILAASATYDVTERYSQYICKGQKQGDDNSSTTAITRPKSTITDANIERYRPLVIVADGQADTKKCQVRAKWEAAVRSGKSRTFAVTVAGWKMPSGELWPINKLVSLQSNWLGVSDTLLIAGMNFRLDEAGELTELALIPAEAYAVIPDDTIKKKTKGAEGNPYLNG